MNFSTNLSVILKKTRVVPVVSLPSVESALTLSEILLENDTPVIEVTFRTSFAAAGLAAIRKHYPDLTLLAGTVLRPQQVDEALESGASAIITPGFSPVLAEYCQTKGIPFYPGVCTPSEVQTAMEAGCSSLKFFPAENAGGIKMLSLFKALYSDVVFMPTGGISPENINDYLTLENVLCCGGTWLCPEKLMAEGKWDEVEKRVKQARQTVQAG